LKVYIDKRERQVNNSRFSENFEVEEATLDIGDYMTDKAIVERKTVADFWSSIIDKRMKNELSSMYHAAKEGMYVKLIIVGYWDQLAEQKKWGAEKFELRLKQLMGMVYSIKNRYRIPVDPVADEEEFVVECKKFFEKAKIWKSPSDEREFVKLKEADDNVKMLTSLRGWTSDKAKNFLFIFGSFEKLVAWYEKFPKEEGKEPDRKARLAYGKIKKDPTKKKYLEGIGWDTAKKPILAYYEKGEDLDSFTI
jgi:ERCC4-type nuclease